MSGMGLSRSSLVTRHTSLRTVFTRWITNHPNLAGLLVGLLVAAVVLLIRQDDALSSRIAIVTIHESDIRDMSQWPLTDQVLAATLEQLLAMGPRAIGVDI